MRPASSALLCAALLGVAGCGGSDDARPIAANAAARAISGAWDRPLVDNVITGADATTSHIVASFTGGSELEHLVAVVFDRPSGSRVLTGADSPRRIRANTSTDVIRVANVVVLYSRAPGVIDRSSAFRAALRRVAEPVR